MLTPVIAHGSFIEGIGDVVIYEIATPEFIKGIDRLVDTPFVEGDAVHWAGDDFNDLSSRLHDPRRHGLRDRERQCWWLGFRTHRRSQPCLSLIEST